MTENEMLKEIYNEMQGIKSGMQEMKSDIQEMQSGMREMKSDMQKMQSGMQEMKSDIQEMQSGMQEMKSNIQEMQGGMQEMKSEIKGLQLTIENEINPNIRIIAEGHLDLTRKLDEALKVENEKEKMLIRVNTIENEVTKIKGKIAGIA